MISIYHGQRRPFTEKATSVDQVPRSEEANTLVFGAIPSLTHPTMGWHEQTYSNYRRDFLIDCNIPLVWYTSGFEFLGQGSAVHTWVEMVDDSRIVGESQEHVSKICNGAPVSRQLISVDPRQRCRCKVQSPGALHETVAELSHSGQRRSV